MNILVIGSGAREHALCCKLASSPQAKKVQVWPGNAVTQKLFQPFPSPAQTSMPELAKDIKKAGVDLVVVGPELHLAAGLVDELHALGVTAFGPSAQAAQLEASKAFAKDVLAAAKVPTARYAVAHSRKECEMKAHEEFEKFGGVVLKASGLAAGKGVFVCENRASLDEAFKMLYSDMFAQSTSQVVVEELMRGRESSHFTSVGRAGLVSLGFAVDFKRLQDGDLGPNTGGMGCYTPVPWLPNDADDIVMKTIVQPTINELKARKIEYLGWLYTGLMWTKQGPKVVEFNVRLGDPEAQVLTAADDSDWLNLILSQCGKQNQSQLKRNLRSSVCVVAASEDYPYRGKSSKPSHWPLAKFARGSEDVKLLAASVKSGQNPEEIVSGSGRVFSCVAVASSLKEAATKAYSLAREVKNQWPTCQMRTDIAGEFLK